MFADVVAEVEGEENSELLDRLGELEVRRREGAAEEAVLLAELAEHTPEAAEHPRSRPLWRPTSPIA